MSDPAGILLHLRLTAAVGNVLNVLTGRDKLPGTLEQQEAEVVRRTAELADAYNGSLVWAKAASKAIEAAEARASAANRQQRRAAAAKSRAAGGREL